MKYIHRGADAPLPNEPDGIAPLLLCWLDFYPILWVDVVCKWCELGAPRLRAAHVQKESVVDDSSLTYVQVNLF